MIGLAILFSLNAASGGRLYEHIVSLNLQRQFWIEQEIISLTYFGVAHFLIVGVALTGALKSLRGLKDGWSLYLLIALLAMVGSIGRLGSSNNYYLESLTVACILFGFSLGRRSHFDKQSLALILVQVLLMFHLPHVFELGPTPDGKELAIGSQLQERIASTQTTVFAENSGWLPIAGHPVILDDTFFFAEMARAGDWNQNTIVSMLQQKNFSLLVLEFNPFMAESAEWYHIVRLPPKYSTLLLASINWKEPWAITTFWCHVVGGIRSQVLGFEGRGLSVGGSESNPLFPCIPSIPWFPFPSSPVFVYSPENRHFHPQWCPSGA